MHMGPLTLSSNRCLALRTSNVAGQVPNLLLSSEKSQGSSASLILVVKMALSFWFPVSGLPPLLTFFFFHWLWISEIRYFGSDSAINLDLCPVLLVLLDKVSISWVCVWQDLENNYLSQLCLNCFFWFVFKFLKKSVSPNVGHTSFDSRSNMSMIHINTNHDNHDGENDSKNKLLLSIPGTVINMHIIT